MSALAIIKEAADCGVRVHLKGEGLALRAATKPSASLLAKLKQHKAEIVALLRQEADVAWPKPDEAKLEKRKGMAMACVPEPYRDAFTRLKCQRPICVGEAAWLQAINDAGRFFDQWASLAVEFGWKPDDLFDVPGEGKSGLIWYLIGETVRSIGPDGAFTTSGRVFDRD